MQVAHFMDEYSRLCQVNNIHVSKQLVARLQKAIDYAEEPDLIEFRGNSDDFKYRRVNDVYLKQAIMKPLASVYFIKALDLSMNELTDIGAEYLADYLKTNRSLKALSLVSNNITEKGCELLAEALQFNQFLAVLQLSYNAIGDQGGNALANMLQINSYLQELYIAGCNLGTRSLISLATVLQSNTSIEVLDISDNKNQSTTLTQSLITSFMTHLARTIRYSPSLKKLGLAKMGITDWIIVDHLASALRDNISLHELDLSGNRIGQDGGVHLAESLKHNKTLQELRLSYCSIQEAGALDMRDMLAVNNSLQRLYLNHNQISGTGLCYLAEGVRRNISLTVLHVWGNHFDERSAEEFAKLLGGYHSETQVGDDSDQLSPQYLKQVRAIQTTRNYVKAFVANVHSSSPGSARKKRLQHGDVDVVVYRVGGRAHVASATDQH